VSDGARVFFLFFVNTQSNPARRHW